MTTERAATEALAGCTFFAAAWMEYFARELAAQPENTVLSVKTRECLWKLVYRYRWQMPEAIMREAQRRLALPAQQRAFESTLDTAPDDSTTRLVYADWLSENGDEDYAAAQRWMCDIRDWPRLELTGPPWGSDGKPTDYNWVFSIMTCGKFEPTLVRAILNVASIFPSRELAERALAKALAAQRTVTT